MSTQHTDSRLKALSGWFFLHFAVDIAFAVPLMFFPETFLSFLGWEIVDPVASRIVSAALFGIGIESLLGMKSPAEGYVGLLNLKIIWSVAVLFGLLLSMIQNSTNSVPFLWVLVAIFAAFNVLWVYWRMRIGRLIAQG